MQLAWSNHISICMGVVSIPCFYLDQLLESCTARFDIQLASQAKSFPILLRPYCRDSIYVQKSPFMSTMLAREVASDHDWDE